MRTAIPALPLTISETDLQQTIVDYARLMRWLVCHYRPLANKNGRWQTPLLGDPGCPDLILARGGVVLLAELKRHGEHPSPSQKKWLSQAGQQGRLWTPTEWNSGEIARTLRHLGRPVVL